MREVLFKGIVVLFTIALAILQPTGSLVGQSRVKNAPVAIEERPILVLGKVDVGKAATRSDSAQLFAAVRTPFMLGNDRVVVPLTRDQQIRVFDLKGNLVAEYGRTGSGPGEFRGLLTAWARGDTIEAFDRNLARVTRFYDGRLLGTVALRGQGSALSGSPGPLGAGWAFTDVLTGGPHARDQMDVIRVGRDGVAVRLNIPLQGMVRYQSAVMAGPTPLSPSAAVASHGDRLYVAETLTPEIRIFDASGRRRGTIQWEVNNPPDPSKAAARVRDLAVKQASASEQTHIGAAPVPERVPVFSSFLVDRDGFVWVRPYVVERDAYALGGPLGTDRNGVGGRWIVFAPDGRRLGAVDVPASLEPKYIGHDVVVGIRRDDLDVEYVEVHRLRRT